MTKEKIEEISKSFRLSGEYFGYPECCIDFFVNRVIAIINAKNHEEFNEKINTLTPQQKIFNNGFIPCPECAELVDEDTIYTLIKNRKCKTEYPDDGSTEDMEKYIGQEMKKYLIY